MHNKFDEAGDRTKQVQIMHKLVSLQSSPDRKQTADLHIWDTLGQEKFLSVANIFFKGTIGAFLVFDLCDKKSF